MGGVGGGRPGWRDGGGLRGEWDGPCLHPLRESVSRSVVLDGSRDSLVDDSAARHEHGSHRVHGRVEVAGMQRGPGGVSGVNDYGAEGVDQGLGAVGGEETAERAVLFPCAEIFGVLLKNDDAVAHALEGSSSGEVAAVFTDEVQEVDSGSAIANLLEQTVLGHLHAGGVKNAINRPQQIKEFFSQNLIFRGQFCSVRKFQLKFEAKRIALD